LSYTNCYYSNSYHSNMSRHRNSCHSNRCHSNSCHSNSGHIIVTEWCQSKSSRFFIAVKFYDIIIIYSYTCWRKNNYYIQYQLKKLYFDIGLHDTCTFNFFKIYKLTELSPLTNITFININKNSMKQLFNQLIYSKCIVYFR